MANNRMWIKHSGGARLLLAKYYPSTGWYPQLHEKGTDLASQLGALFDANRGGMWSLEFENDDGLDGEPKLFEA